MADGGNTAAARAIDVAAQRRILALYEAVADLPAASRDRALADADPATSAAVRAMIARDGEAVLLATIGSDGGPLPDEDEETPERIGPYRIVRELGRGGMGTVYLGERADGLFDHHVAIKLMRAGLPSPAAHAQFAVERRVLARLHHPHIAQFLDGGIEGARRSYIVMELLDGAPITDHCAALPVADRVALFLQACNAVEHAHRNLVVHSDIKPSNVVVTADFGVKLLDFGIARLLGQSDAPVAGAHTPGYGSPAQQAGETASPADDVHALGRLLAALVEGTPADPDLAAIARKAAAADPAERYGAVSELVDDIARWQQHRPVSARPAEPLRRALLYWRRHRVGVAVIAGTILILLATSTITTLLYLRANSAQAAAEARFEQTRQLSRYLLDDVAEALAPLPGSMMLRRRIAERANRTFAELSRLPGASARLRIDAAEAYTEIGSLLGASSNRDGSDAAAVARALDAAVGDLDRLHRTYPANPRVTIALARALVERAHAYSRIDNDDRRALPALSRANRLLGALARTHPRSGEIAITRWDAALVRAEILDNRGEFARNAADLRRLHAWALQLPLPHDAARALRIERGWTFLANALWYTDQKPAALAAYRAGVAALADPALDVDARVLMRRAYAAFNIASGLDEIGTPRAALAAIEPAAETVARLRLFDASVPARNIQNVVTLQHAIDLSAVGRHAEAIAQARRSVAGRREIASLQPDSYFITRSLPVGMRPLAEILREAGRAREACMVFRETDAEWAALAKRHPLSPFDRDTERGEVRRSLAHCAGETAH